MQETQETWIGSLDREDTLEEELVIHPSILAWRIPWTEEPGQLQSIRVKNSRTWLTMHTPIFLHKFPVLAQYIQMFIQIYYIYIFFFISLYVLTIKNEW